MRREIVSIFWSGLGKIGMKGVAFLFSIFLARLLTPDDFGLSGMVTIFIAWATLFTDCGFSAAIIRKNDRTEGDYATVFWFQLCVASLCFGLLWLMAPTIATSLRRVELVWVTRLVALNVVLGALAAVPYTKLRLAGRFRDMSIIDVVLTLVSGVVGLVMAWRGYGVWAIVWQSVSWNAFRVVVYFCVTRWVPTCVFLRNSFNEFLAFGWKQLAASLVNATYSNVHALLIGRFFGAAETGLFNRAQYYAGEPGGLVHVTFFEVAYPSIAEVQCCPAKMRRRFLCFLGAEAFLLFVGLGIFALFAAEIIEFLVGAQWLACVPYIRILVLGAAFEPLRAFLTLPFYVEGRMEIVLKLEFAETVVALILVFAALPFGIIAICWAKTTYHIGSFIVNGIVLWKRSR